MRTATEEEEDTILHGLKCLWKNKFQMWYFDSILTNTQFRFQEMNIVIVRYLVSPIC